MATPNPFGSTLYNGGEPYIDRKLLFTMCSAKASDSSVIFAKDDWPTNNTWNDRVNVAVESIEAGKGVNDMPSYKTLGTVVVSGVATTVPFHRAETPELTKLQVQLEGQDELTKIQVQLEAQDTRKVLDFTPEADDTELQQMQEVFSAEISDIIPYVQSWSKFRREFGHGPEQAVNSDKWIEHILVDVLDLYARGQSGVSNNPYKRP